MAKITAPVKGFTGEVVGVAFNKGSGETTDRAALAYFRRHGYTVVGDAPKGRGRGKAGEKPADTKPDAESEEKTDEGDAPKGTEGAGAGA